MLTTVPERFTVVHGRVGFRLTGREAIAKPGERLRVPAGMVHDWWNAGGEQTHVIVEIRPGARFEEMIKNLFGPAQETARRTPRACRTSCSWP
jgi:mannose-6-phosphate isomerase-like protein (cupin superfamily)